ncbi:MAG: PLP-dependent transferase [Gemmatimonadota bacterium]|nr:PLP-dependent transferase [Gemmatimonadota bacterium]
MPRRDEMKLASWVVAGGRDEAPGSPLNVPPVTASNFVLGGDFVYAREEGTATVLALEELVGGMEGGKALAFASGMAAAAAVFDRLPAGSAVAIPADCYQGVARLASAGSERGRWTVRRIALADTAGWLDAMESCDLVWLESPSNPLLAVADLPAICAAPRRAGNIVVVDNTFATPFHQRPLSFGADVAMHSVTKFIGGHSDLLAGVLVMRDETLRAGLHETRTLTGAVPGALESFLALRGARTMALRLERAGSTAGLLAERLARRPDVETVRYPGLASHPTHDVAARVLDGFGSILSFDVEGGGTRADALCRGMRLIRNATSLGGVDTTIERRAVHEGQEHLPPGLLRLSVGCEDPDDLWADLSAGLDATA